MQPYTYLLLNVGTILFPFLLSFDKKVYFYKRWKYLWPAIAIVAVLFIAWDMAFTHQGIWGFNPDYLTGITIGNLPLEEVLFFITVPYACVFIFDVLKAYLNRDYIGVWAPYITMVTVLGLWVLALLNLQLIYTSITFGLTGVLLVYLQFVRKETMGWFYLAYAIHLIPFLLVNGVLTSLPVVEYNDAYNLSIRLHTIPVEDTIYSMLLLFGNIGLYRYFQQRWNKTVF